MLDEATIKMYLEVDPDISNFQTHHEGLYQFDARINKRPDMAPANIIVSTKVNTLVVIMLAKIDLSGNGLAAALAATGQVSVVGVAKLGDDFYLRYAFFREFAEPAALNNGVQALALAHNFYLQER